jgi:hypothetical protein
MLKASRNRAYLAWKVNFNGLDANILRASRHREAVKSEISQQRGIRRGILQETEYGGTGRIGFEAEAELDSSSNI